MSAYTQSMSTDDILHARIQTMGVAEHVFDVNMHGKAVTWHLFDVGGARGQRHSWVPYFDDANAIIFVAPVSAFDQVRQFLHIRLCFGRPLFLFGRPRLICLLRNILMIS